jgi:NAD(P)-dependent dehydrogenase (short-subunit alcohol dehydrogenase family)
MKTVLITGATRGIGRSVALEFSKNNYHVIGLGSKPRPTPDYLHEYISCDFTDNTQIDIICMQLCSMNIDVLINNAGINYINDFCSVPLNEFQAVQQVNVVAPFRLCQAVLPPMAQQQYGRIVNISSVWGKISKTGRASYSASKFAIDGITVAAANEYASQGVLVNSVAPGFINTEMTRKNLGDAGIAAMLTSVPINRLAAPAEIAKFVYWLGSEENTYISGQNIAIDGGFTRA